MKRKTFMKKRAYLLLRMLQYAEKNTTTTPESMKKAYKSLYRQQIPDFAQLHSYQEAYDKLYKVLGQFQEA